MHHGHDGASASHREAHDIMCVSLHVALTAQILAHILSLDGLIYHMMTKFAKSYGGSPGSPSAQITTCRSTAQQPQTPKCCRIACSPASGRPAGVTWPLTCTLAPPGDPPSDKVTSDKPSVLTAESCWRRTRLRGVWDPLGVAEGEVH